MDSNKRAGVSGYKSVHFPGAQTGFKALCVHTYPRLLLLFSLMLYKGLYMLVSAAVKVGFQFFF